MVTIRNETHGDIDAREALLDRVWGAARFEKTAERLREGRTPAAGLALVAEENDQEARRHGPAVARLRRTGAAGLAARPAGGRGGAARLWRRRGLDAARARDGAAARPSSGDPGRRPRVLQPVRLFGGEDRRAVAAGSVRAASPARLRAYSRRARWRARSHRRHRPAGTGAEPRLPHRQPRARRNGCAARGVEHDPENASPPDLIRGWKPVSKRIVLLPLSFELHEEQRI